MSARSISMPVGTRLFVLGHSNINFINGASGRSARMPNVFRALPSLRTLLLHRGLTGVDKQAIALSLALAAYRSVSQPRTAARIAWRGQFFIHLIATQLNDRAA